MNAYVLCWRPTKFWLIGPFPDAEAAFQWACDETNNPADDPNWFILPLVRNPGEPVEVVPPTEPMPDSGALWALTGQLCPRPDTDDDGYEDWERGLRDSSASG